MLSRNSSINSTVRLRLRVVFRRIIRSSKCDFTKRIVYIAVYAHDKEEAVNLFTGSDSIEEETYEKEIVGNMVDEAFDKYKVVKEYKDRRTEEVCIAEFNVLM